MINARIYTDTSGNNSIILQNVDKHTKVRPATPQQYWSILLASLQSPNRGLIPCAVAETSSGHHDSESIVVLLSFNPSTAEECV